RPLSKDTKAARFVSLFNGADLNGWEDALPNNPGEWRAVDGILEGGGGGRGNPAVLVTNRPAFTNYKLRVAFGFPRAGGAHIQLRRSGAAEGTSCYPVSIWAGSDWQTSERPAGNVTKLKDYHYGARLPPARESERVNTSEGTWHTLEIAVVRNVI